MSGLITPVFTVFETGVYIEGHSNFHVETKSNWTSWVTFKNQADTRHSDFFKKVFFQMSVPPLLTNYKIENGKKSITLEKKAVEVVITRIALILLLLYIVF